MASESESEKRETLADIVAELRSITFAMKVHDAMMPDVHDILCDVASRIEAAWKREMTEAEANALAVGGLVEAERQRVVVSKTETTTPFSLPKAPVRPRRPVANVGQVSDRIRRQAEIIFFGRTA